MTMQSTATPSGIASATMLLNVSRRSRARLWVGIAMVTDFICRKKESRRWLTFAIHYALLRAAALNAPEEAAVAEAAVAAEVLRTRPLVPRPQASRLESALALAELSAAVP
jgi:hypothetical protein